MIHVSSPFPHLGGGGRPEALLEPEFLSRPIILTLVSLGSKEITKYVFFFWKAFVGFLVLDMILFGDEASLEANPEFEWLQRIFSSKSWRLWLNSEKTEEGNEGLSYAAAFLRLGLWAGLLRGPKQRSVLGWRVYKVTRTGRTWEYPVHNHT